MGELIQGLDMIYKDNGNSVSWIVEPNTGHASRNPLAGNDELRILRVQHKKQLARCGKPKVRPHTLTVSLLCTMQQDSSLVAEQLTTEMCFFMQFYSLD